MTKLRLGLIINPVAGLGGTVALKGTDGVAAAALQKGAQPQVGKRVETFLTALGDQAKDISWFTCAGAMGADVLKPFVQDFILVGNPATSAAEGKAALAPTTTAEDTRQAAAQMEQLGIDLLLFAGGDGTARDLVDVLQQTPAVLGIPSGVKMHSGVFASSPVAAAKLVTRLLQGELVSMAEGEVRDLDEASLRAGKVNSRFYGELPVPSDLRYLQQTKVGGKESAPLVIEEIAAQVRELAQAQPLMLMGAGSTLAGIMASLGVANTLLGVDAVMGGALVGSDLTEQEIWALLQAADAAQLYLSFTGGQGYLFGRGNQQLSPRCIRKLGRNNIHILATKSKLAELDGRPLLVDTGERDLDESLAGLARVITGYEDEVFYRLEAA